VLGCWTPTIFGVVKNDPMTSNGLIFKPVADVYKFKEMRNIMTSIPQSYLKLQQGSMATHISDLEELQGKLKNNENFKVVVNEIKKLANSLEEINDMLTGSPKISLKLARRRRAILPFVGSVIEWAFGNPDDTTKKEMLELMRKLSSNQEATDRVVLNHSIFIRSLTESIKAKNRMVNEEIASIIRNLNSTLSRFNATANEIELQNELNIYTQVLTLYIVRHKSYQDKILMHILSNTPIHIDPEIIPLPYLSPIIVEIEKSLGNDQMLPFNLIPNRTTIDWYKYIPMRTSIVEKNIVFEFFIPVVTRAKKQLLEVISAPFPKGEHLVYIQPQSQYILTNDINTEIAYLTQSNINECWKLNGDKQFVCPSSFPIFNMLPQDNYCELTILLKTHHSSHNCVFKILPKKDLFIKIQKSDQYYYVVNKEMNFTTKCGEKDDMISLNGTGFITINDSCSIYNQFLRIESQSTTGLYKNMNYVQNTFTPIINKNPDKYKFIINDKELNDLNKEFEKIKEKLKYDENFDNLSMTENWAKYQETAKIQSGINISTSIIILFVVLVSIYILGELRDHKKNNRNAISIATYIAEEKIDHEVKPETKPTASWGHDV
jgi:IS1 family transposase